MIQKGPLMATKKLNDVSELVKDEDGTIWLDDPTTIKVAEGRKKYNGPMVDIYLPALEEEGSGVKVDQYEHVTIANEEREDHYKVRRGTHVEVPVPVFEQLKLSGRYPNL